jgi:hypothetical protein
VGFYHRRRLGCNEGAFPMLTYLKHAWRDALAVAIGFTPLLLIVAMKWSAL